MIRQSEFVLKIVPTVTRYLINGTDLTKSASPPPNLGVLSLPGARYHRGFLILEAIFQHEGLQAVYLSPKGQHTVIISGLHPESCLFFAPRGAYLHVLHAARIWQKVETPPP